MAATTTAIDYRTALRLSAIYGCDWRTIARVAQGLPVRGLAGERAREALRTYLAELAAQGLAMADIPESR